MTSPISAAADALKARHGTLLTRERPQAMQDDETRVAALDAARERLQGGPKPPPVAVDQLSLDLRAR